MLLELPLSALDLAVSLLNGPEFLRLRGSCRGALRSSVASAPTARIRCLELRLREACWMKMHLPSLQVLAAGAGI